MGSSIDTHAPSQISPRRRTIGLALSGGGFRASFFHLGVLRRLAELDLLRDVNTISTVSGGSIVGAHYVLLLAAHVATSSDPITRDDYLSIVDTLEDQFCAGVDANLRTLLVCNPLQNMLLLSTIAPLGESMAKLYESRIYRSAIRSLNAVAHPGLGDRRATDARPESESIDGSGRVAEGFLESTPRLFDARLRRGKQREWLPKLVLNATSLNSGRNFRLTPAEIGDAESGYLRHDEIEVVLAYKRLLGEIAAMNLHLAGAVDALRKSGLQFFYDRPLRERPDEEARARKELAEHRVSNFVAGHLAAWLALDAEDTPLPEAARPDKSPEEQWGSTFKHQFSIAANNLPWKLFDHLHRRDVAVLAESEFGAFRRAKIAAWLLVRGPRRDEPLDARTEMVARFWEALRVIDPVWGDEVRSRVGDPERTLHFADLLVDIYYFRSAKRFSDDVRAIRKLSLAQAVAASANFPPVFPPYRISDVYDAPESSSLLLTDGGVQDNQGINALLEEDCTHIVVSDAGSQFSTEHVAPYGRFKMLARLTSMMQENGHKLLLERLQERARRIEPDPQPTGSSPRERFLQLRGELQYAVITLGDHVEGPGEMPRPDALEPHPQAREIARIRTDLDCFDADEIDGLVYEGYRLADDQLSRVFGLAPSAQKPVAPVRLDDPPPAVRGFGIVRRAFERVTHGPQSARARRRDVLRASSGRFLRPFRRTGSLKYLLVGASVLSWIVLVVGAISTGGISLADFWLRLTAPLSDWYTATMVTNEAGIFTRKAFFAPVHAIRGWSQLKNSAAWTLGGVPVLSVVYMLAARRWKLVRSIARRMARGFWWLFGLAPLWISLLVSIAGWILWAGAKLTVRPSTERRRHLRTDLAQSPSVISKAG